MSADRTQTYANHRRFFALYHYIALPIVALNVVYTAFLAFRAPNASTIWSFVFAIGVASGVLAARTMVLIVQNRVIRLEQRLRLVALLPDRLRGRIVELNLSQLIGLRFASDAELASLVERCLAGELKNGEDVKKAISSWQADFLRA
jgi:uncharacterized membrane protein YciS (DUF1049 family)